MADFSYWMRTFLNGLSSYWPHLIAGGVLAWLAWKILRNPKFYLCVIKTLPRDFGSLPKLARLRLDLRKSERQNLTIFKAFDSIVKRNPSKPLLYFEDQVLTAKQLQDLSHQVANFFQRQGIKKGDAVGIFMENCADYVAIWLGLSRIGCVSSLINYNLRLKPLKHCIEAVNCKALIFSPSLQDGVKELLEVEGPLVGDPTLYYFQEGGQKDPSTAVGVGQNLNRLLENEKKSPPSCPEAINFGDRIMYIFTSGTTGLPKAASIKHSRMILMGASCYYVSRMNPNDRFYTALPLYHGSGTMLGTGITLIYGPAQIIRRKFSASAFWKDCIKYEATAAQYIGETCRYILAQPEGDLDKAHGVRVMFGNGLRGEIWGDFVNRFGVKISEFYGSTEGNCGMANLDSTIGAVGFVPIWYERALPMRLIKVDEETGEPIRDPKSGFAIKCRANEPGELVGKIVRHNPIADFEGYADKSSTQGKIMENAFRKGDAWFRSGDVLVQDEFGYFYFRDRKGDTFRWKGENCSTTEVESILSFITGLKGAVVFGVEVPGCDGRAGMAVISDPDNSLDLDLLAGKVIKSLPPYARPLFIRIVSQDLDMTGTYKLKKNDYQKAGFNINLTDDKVYFFDGKKYILVDKELYNDVISKKLRL